MQLSEHFTLDEMVHSQTALRLGIDNTPDADQIDNLERLCVDLLEPIRALLAVPIAVDSGYRSPALNAAVGGSKDSEHMVGCAADLVPMGLDLQAAFDTVRLSALPYDQVIFECRAWIHVGIAPLGATPRRQALTASGTPGHWSYQPV